LEIDWGVDWTAIRSIGEKIVWIYLPIAHHIIKFLSIAILISYIGVMVFSSNSIKWMDGLEASLILLLLVQSEVRNCSEFLVFVH